jgi:hypothetical protein
MKTTFKAEFTITVDHNRDTFIDFNSVKGLLAEMVLAGRKSPSDLWEVGDKEEASIPAKKCATITVTKFRSTADGNLQDELEDFEGDFVARLAVCVKPNRPIFSMIKPPQ